ncbi:L-lactate permease lctP-like protein [Staphylococcus microti]|nr:L-lactate permease [Staphylococcus microti]SUM58366.1 L-lactate permease lctP-like protein [Staphylococcus microti]
MVELDNQLGDDNMSLLIAVLPIIIIFICLFVFRYSALKSGVIAFISTVIIVFIKGPYQISYAPVMEATISAVLISSIAAYVIFFGILLFHLMNESENIKAISHQIKNLTDDKALQVIILVMGISPLIESTSGFGTAFLVVTPIFIALGIDNYKAACIGILSLIAVPWGALATGTVIGAQLVNIDLQNVGYLTAILTFLTITFFLMMCLFILGGYKTVLANKWRIVIYPLTFSFTNLIFNHFISVELAGVFSSLLAIIIGIGNVKLYNQKNNNNYKRLLWLLSPYIILTVLVLVTRIIPSFKMFLSNHMVVSFEQYHFQLPVLYSPGFWLILACVYTIIKFQIHLSIVQNAIRKTFKQWGLFVISTTSFIALAEIMDVSGMISEISTSLTDQLGSYFIILSSVIGSIGGFLTGSNTGANAMFMKLQVQAAQHLNISSELIASLQNASASNATMSTPSRIMLASEICGVKDQESRLQAYIIKIMMVSTMLLVVTAYLLNWFI